MNSPTRVENHAPIILVTGTDTDVGKTVATAAIAAALSAQGVRVAVVKPTQTGLQPGEPGDMAEVKRLAGDAVETFEFIRLPDPLAPDSAARRAQIALPTVCDHARDVAAIAAREDIDTVIVEGAGGLLVHLDEQGKTLADMAIQLRSMGLRAGFVLVTSPRLGTLNVTQLTAEALDIRGLELIGYLVGSYPQEPDLAEQTNLDDLAAASRSHSLGQLPADAAALDPNTFRTEATKWVHL